VLMPDVNVLVSAHRTDAPQHEIARGWLEDAINGSEALGLTDAVSAGYVRIVTHPRVFADPTPLESALDHLARLREAAGVLRVTPGRAHWDVFARLCREADARGNLVSDAAHAATAVEAGATWVTFDRDFARFPGLRWRVPESARS
jgi:uncharacterized protein